MLRETKVGIAISCAFLGLAGTVIATKLRQQDNANIESRVQEIRPAPQSKPVAVSSGPRASSTPGTLSPDVKDKGSEVRPVVAEEKVASATGMTDTWPPPIPLTPSPDPKKKVKGTEPIDPESTVIPAPGVLLSAPVSLPWTIQHSSGSAGPRPTCATCGHAVATMVAYPNATRLSELIVRI